jgi:hypothetical protein
MASIISAGTSAGTAIAISGDTTGNLAFTTQAGANTITVPNSTGTIVTTGTPASGNIIQVVSTTKTDTTSTTSSTFSDISGLSVSITPKFSTSKIYVTAFMVSGGRGEFSHMGLRLMRDSTAICIGTSATGNRTNATAILYDIDRNNTASATVAFLDSPASTSALTYKMQFKSSDNSSAVYLNRPYNDTDLSYITYCASTITVMEIAG